jgi:molybdopterin-binding protein
MTKVKGYIVGLEFTDTISQVMLSTELGDFYCVILENPDTVNYLRMGNEVNLIFKESDYTVFKEKVYPFNTIEGNVRSIVKGEIFVKVVIKNKDYEFSALITNPEFESLNIQINQKLHFFVKPTSVILEV